MFKFVLGILRVGPQRNATGTSTAALPLIGPKRPTGRQSLFSGREDPLHFSSASNKTCSPKHGCLVGFKTERYLEELFILDLYMEVDFSLTWILEDDHNSSNFCNRRPTSASINRSGARSISHNSKPARGETGSGAFDHVLLVVTAVCTPGRG